MMLGSKDPSISGCSEPVLFDLAGHFVFKILARSLSVRSTRCHWHKAVFSRRLDPVFACDNLHFRKANARLRMPMSMDITLSSGDVRIADEFVDFRAFSMLSVNCAFVP